MSSESVKSKHGPARVAISVPRQFRERVRKSEVAFPEQERDRYVSRSLGYVVLLNGVAALILVAALAFAPQSTTDSHRLAWAMMVFGSGAMAGLLSSLFAYIGRLVTVSLASRVVIRDLLRVGAIVMAVGAAAAFLTGLNMMALTLPEGSSTRPKSKPETHAPSPTGSITFLKNGSST